MSLPGCQGPAKAGSRLRVSARRRGIIGARTEMRIFMATMTYTVPVTGIDPVEVAVTDYGSGQPFLLLHGGQGRSRWPGSPSVPDGAALRAGTAARITLATAAAQLGTWDTRISRLERGLTHDSDLARRYQHWLSHQTAA
jgi:hypothetical protein